ncbi:MAG: methionine adenosyltransferase [Anaerobutyricum soehngenii]
MNKDITLLTSESVTEGHPDKMCDMISDALLDAYLKEDPSAHVAWRQWLLKTLSSLPEKLLLSQRLMLKIRQEKIICEIGYDSKEKGIDGNECLILTNIGVQSPDIAQGVTQCNGTIGAGDQGMMYGYACDDTEELMPLSISLAHKLSKRLTQVRKEGLLPYLYPDGKSQVTVAYNNQGEILGITDVVISAQHNAEVSVQKLRMDIEEHVIKEVIPKELLLPDVKIHINPTGRFVVGGPAGDVGLTGRKIIVDTYGGIARHGGGAFSGKDPTKVDRSAAYMARYAAKNVVAAGFCKKCEVNLAYAIGVPQLVSIKIDTFGTEELPKEIIEDTIKEVFDFSVAGIINNLSLTKVTYKPVAAYGHFGRTELNLPWERLDKVTVLQEKAVARMAEEICKNR